MGNIRDYKITVIGDSITKGVIINNGRIVSLETNAIKEIEKHYNIEIKNNSMFGQTLKKIYEKGLIDKYLETIDKSSNNLIVISLGGNDCDFNWQDVEKTPNEYHSSKTTLKEFLYFLREITTKLQKNNVTVVFTNLFPVDSKRYFENVITKKCNKESILQFLKNDISNIYRHQECFNQAIIHNAAKHNCKVLDIRNFFLMNIGFLECIADDGVHPNINGQIAIAKTIIEQLS